MFFLKTLLGIFKIALRLRDRHVFMRQSLEILTVFNTLTLHQIVWITKTFFDKLDYCFLVESMKIENASFPYKTAMLETNVKTNRMGFFVSSNFIFLKILFQFKNLFKRVDLMYQLPKCQYSYFL